MARTLPESCTLWPNGGLSTQPYMQPYPGQSVFARPEEDEEE
nr:hypothetical protein [Bacillus pumilus]